MTKEFKIALMPYLIEGGTLVTYLLQNIDGWPMIDMTDKQQDGEKWEEPVDTENCEFVDYTDDTLIIACGGDWQEPHTIIIKFEDNQVRVSESYQSEFHDGIDYMLFEALFLELLEFVPKDPETLAQLEESLENALYEEDYNKAALLRDEINKRKSD